MGEVLYVSQKQNEYVLTDEFKEKNSGEIMTVQNDAYTIKELLEKFTTGVFKPVQFERQVQYIDESGGVTELRDFVDITDIEEYQAQINAKLEALKASQTVKSSPSEPDEEEGGTTDDD